MVRFKSERPILKQYFSIGEVAQILQEPKYTVRYWSDEFFDHIKRIHHLNRLYTRKDLAKLHVIKTLLREDKFTFAGAKQKLKLK